MSREYPKYPIIGVGVVVTSPLGILLIKRTNPPGVGKWSLPGGAQDTGETIEQTALREVREETGLKIDYLGLVDVIDSIIKDDQGEVQYHYTLIDVAARVHEEQDGRELCAGDDADDAKWFSRDQLDALNLWSETIRVIDASIAKFG